MENSRARGLRFATAILTSALFLAAICTPPVASMLKINPHVPLQEAALNPMPEVRPDTIGQIIYMLRRNWLDRNFGLRKVLLRWEQLLDVRLLKSSMPTDPVLAGENGWLYLAQENPQLNVIADYRANNLLTPGQLDVWVKVFAARRDWLAARGIRYMVVVAANKASVYPEHIPARFNRVNQQSKLDQMVKALSEAGLDVVELRTALVEAKEKRLSYYRTDSHWTPYGAFFGYQEVARRLGNHFPGLVPLSIDDYRVVEKPGLLGGLSYMIALGDLYPENEVLLEPLGPRKAYKAGGQEAVLNHFQPLTVWENQEKTLPRAFVIRDSFVHEIIPFLAEHFSRMYFVWPFPTDAVRVRGFDTEAIEQEKPDIVIDEFVERYFTQPPPASALKDLPGAK
jgi:O6-methylguanine-DNA--protein-cysteine methyltransferase